jgi:hypothetical protein
VCTTLMETLVESACEAALLSNTRKKRTIIFCGEAEQEVTVNLHTAAKYIASKYGNFAWYEYEQYLSLRKIGRCKYRRKIANT